MDYFKQLQAIPRSGRMTTKIRRIKDGLFQTVASNSKVRQNDNKNSTNQRWTIPNSCKQFQGQAE